MTRVEIILRALDIEVVRVRGRRAWALCIFHEDHEASNFFVRTQGERAGSFHCFACKAGGTLAELVMHVRSVDHSAARAFIATSGKDFRPPALAARVVERPALRMRPAFELPRECIMGKPLDTWTPLARRYAVKRSITQDEVARYGLGYAVDARLAGRIIFPVRVGPKAVAVGYSARSFAGAERRYLTPHESENADLDALFGEHLWPAPEQREAICVTEGAINALACVRASNVHASSISGSDVRAGHVIKLATFKIVVVLTDSDAAGNAAATKFRMMLGHRVNLIRGVFPPGMDADDLGPDRLGDMITRCVVQGSAS